MAAAHTELLEQAGSQQSQQRAARLCIQYKAAEVHQGLFMDRDCWTKELLEALMFVDPTKDWHTHMMQLKPVENPKGVARLAKQKFAES
jgi:hypothetical protein